MRIVRQTFHLPESSYPLENLLSEGSSLDQVLFFDIETTGFAAKNSNVYLIGCAYKKGEDYELTQWFANSYDEELEIIRAFYDFSSHFTTLVHFNGTNFDIPFLEQKCAMHKLPYHFSHLQGIDLYRRVAPYKLFLKTPNFKQKTVEYFLGIGREDTYSGGELINVYHQYVEDPNTADLELLLLHNADDIKGLIEILPILSYYDLFNKPLKAKKVQANTYTDYFGTIHRELLIRCSLPTSLPVPVKAGAVGCYFNGEDKVGHFRIPLYEEEMKYFYANYKDYYYMPDEDVAIHRSVATFVDRDHRMKAKAENCYTRKFSSYLPEWDLFIEPFFKRDYKSKDLFFELTEEMKTDRDFFSRYAEHVLHMLANAN
jgi:uncharacterized protein YprB with RNaseH-like and TPR domain